ncbi:MAG: Hpt domain-containing protein [bacterium]|nr:Hpt domain-containing protein [bacterium]
MTDSDEIFMEELKQEFKESIRKYLVDLPDLFGESNFEEIARIAHDIKGTAGVFGYDEGTELGKDLQHAAQDKDEGQTGELIARLAEYMKKNVLVDG